MVDDNEEHRNQRQNHCNFPREGEVHQHTTYERGDDTEGQNGKDLHAGKTVVVSGALRIETVVGSSKSLAIANKRVVV